MLFLQQNNCIMKRFATILFMTALTICSFAADRRYVYTQIAQNEGLTSTVNSIYKERDGAVWIGTPSGLYRFDGYSLKLYNDALYGSKKVFHVGKDSRDDMWILTERHILKYDRERDGFTMLSGPEAPYKCMYSDIGGIWFGSLEGLYRYSYKDKSLSRSHVLPRGFECQSINRLDDRRLLCCSHSGQYVADTETGEVRESPFGQETGVSASLIDRNGRVWIAYYNKGICVYETDGTQTCRFSTADAGLSNDIVLCLAEREDQVLAGTDGGGINIIDFSSGKVRVLSHISGDPASFPAHSIKSLHVDNYDNIWAGSIRDGLISVSQSKMNSYGDTHIGLTNGLSNPTVLCLHQETDSEHIWIGTDGEGINRFNPKTSRFKHFDNTYKTKVVSIARYSDKELAVSTYSDNIWTFDKETGAMKPIMIADESIRQWIRFSGRSINLYNESDGDLIMFANQLYRYDSTTGICAKIALEGDASSYSNFLVAGRSKEGIWIHNNNNIYLLPDDSDRILLKGVHENGIIRSGWLADDGTIWLATEEGLCRFNTSDNTFGHITTSIFSDAVSVVCDRRARVWIGTEKGLSAYLTESGSFAMFGKSDGVEPNEYLQKPRLIAANGDVYLGGVTGLLRIGESYTIETTEIPVLDLADTKADGEDIIVGNDRLVKVSRNCNTMDIGISVVEKDMFRNRVFRFTVSGQTYETTVPTLSLQQMPSPGKHDITVSCTRRNGEWTSPVKIMTLKVPQPWYASWWFIGSCILLFFAIYVLTIIAVNKHKEGEMKLAMKEQEQKVYQDKVNMLINISHELRTPLTLIIAPLKRMLKNMDGDDRQLEVLSRIYRQSRRMHNLLDMVLDLRKMEVEGNRLKISEVTFNSWIEDSVNDIVNEEKAEGIDITYSFDPSVRKAEIDRQKCDIVLMNILINAIKHSTAGDCITIKTELTEEGMIRTSVMDQGPGLGADIDPEKMFTRFYQSKSEKYGSGIGLSYSRILVEMHGGKIGVYNNDDRGATFWWEVPVSAVTDTDLEDRAYLNELLGHSSEADSAAGEEQFNTSGMKLMLVDDNQDLLDFLREALCEDFADIVTVTGGEAAMNVIMSGKLPDIIVSDVNMPEGDGFWLCNTLKSNDKFSHIPLVLLTARGEDQSQSESYRLGADGFLAKPFEIETLMELLRNILRRKADIRKKYLDNEEVAEADYGSNEERLIIRLNQIIADNLSNPALDQQLICRELGVSRALLYNRMKAITGTGAKEYITKIRIEKAKSLMETTSLTIAEISDMTGFTSQSYFSTAFKNYEGMTPSGYKQHIKTRTE